ncbi:MAG: hypothetical protein JO244_14815 [Solirubrobacterales bacterium]|nr:hypothetical protein [Solirubrobacterales bacterium]
MKHQSFTLSLVGLLALVAGTTALADPITSGPPAGARVPGPFRPLHVTGPDAGERVCLYCKNGANPVAVVFARETTPAVAALIKQIDVVTAARTDCHLGSFVVFLGDTEKLTGPVRALAANQRIRDTILTVDDPGPKSYRIAPEAAVTVLLYTHHTVKATHAFRAGELNDKATAAILADLDKMLPAK